MFFKATLYAALFIFIAGTVYRIGRWFVKSVGLGDSDVTVAQRIASGVRATLATIFSVRLIGVLKVLILDGLLQIRILRDRGDSLVWVMHLFIFVGFAYLLFFHALGSIFAVAIDPEYESTLNPYMFLRNLGGGLVLAGLIMAVIRRTITMKSRIKTTGMDVGIIVILAVIIVSGFLLESLKITSPAEFADMVEEYSDIDDPADRLALESYWVAKYGLVSSGVVEPVASHTLSKGLELHEESCIDCHSPPRSAFISYPVSRLTKPLALSLDRIEARTAIRYLHFLACFCGLALLAFSKMFHMISTPISLMISEVTKPVQDHAATANRQAIELDGCSHGGVCHEQCPVRRKRLERIAQTIPYDPMLAYAGEKSAANLGSREVSK